MVPFVLRPYPQFLWLTLGITSAASRCLRYIYGWRKTRKRAHPPQKAQRFRSLSPVRRWPAEIRISRCTRVRAIPSSTSMKVSHIATIAFLSASAIGMTGAVSVVARQFTIERSAVRSLLIPASPHDFRA